MGRTPTQKNSPLPWSTWTPSNTPMPRPTPLTSQTTALLVHALPPNYVTNSPLVITDASHSPPKLPRSLERSPPHLIHPFVDRSYSPSQTASRSNQPLFPQLTHRTNRQITGRQTRKNTCLRCIVLIESDAANNNKNHSCFRIRTDSIFEKKYAYFNEFYFRFQRTEQQLRPMRCFVICTVLSVCTFGNDREFWKENDSLDRDAVRGDGSGGSKEPRIIRGSRSPGHSKGKFLGELGPRSVTYVENATQPLSK